MRAAEPKAGMSNFERTGVGGWSRSRSRGRSTGSRSSGRRRSIRGGRLGGLLFLLASFIAFLHLGVPGIVILSRVVPPTPTVRTVAAPGFLPFSKRIGPCSGHAWSRRSAIDGIPTSIMEGRILASRGSPRIRTARRVTGSRSIEVGSALGSRDPVTASKLSLVFVLATCEEGR
jgi:hypothetical protein